MKSPLKRSVNEHLESVRLEPSRLRELERVQRQAAARRWWPRHGWAVAAAAVVVAAITVVLLPWQAAVDDADRAVAIAEEVAVQHLKRRPLEVRGATIAAVEDYFDELGFRLLDSLRAAPGAELLGGRYCSVQGVIAAQLRRRDAAGRTQSLFQAPYDAARFGPLPDVGNGEAPRTLQVRGLNVDLWVERGLLFALTRES
ncbi:MAG: hypothetical protein QNJ91_13045 [Gammaproteobacteria bacterium]|nr:hypothetical protein [Gammaproteobacteria bacterium]